MNIPRAVEIEKSVISACLQWPDRAVTELLSSGGNRDWFSLPETLALFDLVLEASETNTTHDLKVICQKLTDSGQLEEIGGAGTVANIYTAAATMGSFKAHLNILRDKTILRQMLISAEDHLKAISESEQSADDLLDSFESDLSKLRQATTQTTSKTIKDSALEAIETYNKILSGESSLTGLSSGYQGIDIKSSGFKPGDLIIIAARPSMGKTAIALNIAERLTMDQQVSGMIFSLEMPTAQLVQRMVFSRARIDIGAARRGHKPSRHDFTRLKNAARDIVKAPLVIDDEASLTITALRAKARRAHREDKIQFIVVDYLQLMRSTSRQAQGSREREVAEISSGLKALAKELDIPVICLAQLNRGPESRGGERIGVPRMSDLRESGAIEQDADLIGLLYRPAYYAQTDEEAEQLAGQAVLLVGKNRNGPTGEVNLTFLDSLMRFEDRAPDHQHA